MRRYGDSFVTQRRPAPVLPWRRRAVLGIKRELESVTSWRMRTLRAVHASGVGGNDA